MWVSACESAASAADVSVMQSVFPVRGGGGQQGGAANDTRARTRELTPVSLPKLGARLIHTL